MLLGWKTLNKEQKRKLGIGIYYTALILTIVIMLAVLVVVKSEDAEYVSRIRYIVAFYCFTVLLGGSAIVREFLVDEFILKKMIIKIIATAVAILIGTVFFIAIPTASVALMMIFLGMGVLLYDAVPTVPKGTEIKK